MEYLITGCLIFQAKKAQEEAEAAAAESQFF